MRSATWSVLTLALGVPVLAHAYPFMIREGYTECATCHTDPSGGTFLNAYGRAQSELLLSSSYGGGESEGNAGRLLGVVSQPDWLRVGGWVRQGYLWNVVNGSVVDRRWLQMRADLGADVKIGVFRAAAELGYSSAGSTPLTQLAQITRSAEGPNLVGREMWAGVELFDGEGLLRAGRINLPFGLRNIEHTSFVRTATQTDINEDQQYGVAFAVSKPSWRAEVMALVGNFSVHPDAYRERGGVGYAELTLAPTTAVGVSALVARSDASLITKLPTLRQAYGGFLRTSPWHPLVLQMEADVLLNKELNGGPQDVGHAEWLQADVEVVRGLHLLGAAEGMKTGTTDFQTGLWGGIWWFLFPHFDIRADAIQRWGQGPSNLTFLVQLNGYL